MICVTETNLPEICRTPFKHRRVSKTDSRGYVDGVQDDGDDETDDDDEDSCLVTMQKKNKQLASEDPKHYTYCAMPRARPAAASCWKHCLHADLRHGSPPMSSSHLSMPLPSATARVCRKLSIRRKPNSLRNGRRIRKTCPDSAQRAESFQDYTHARLFHRLVVKIGGSSLSSCN